MMSFIDIAIIVVVLLSSIIGIIRGFVREVLSLVAWGAAFYIAATFRGELTPHLTFISPEVFRELVSFVAIFLGVLLAFSLFNYVIAKLVDSTGISGTDRTLGVIFGAIRGAAIVIVLVVMAGLLPVTESKAWQSSFLIPHITEVAEELKKYLPSDLAEKVNIPEFSQDELEITKPVIQDEVIQSEAIIVEGN